MKLVRTDEARPGQRVARDVNDLRGNLLFKAGTELNVELISCCRQRNVSHLFIEEEDKPAAFTPAEVEARRQALVQDVDRQFAGTEASAVMTALKEAAKRHLVGRLGK